MLRDDLRYQPHYVFLLFGAFPYWLSALIIFWLIAAADASNVVSMGMLAGGGIAFAGLLPLVHRRGREIPFLLCAHAVVLITGLFVLPFVYEAWMLFFDETNRGTVTTYQRGVFPFQSVKEVTPLPWWKHTWSMAVFIGGAALLLLLFEVKRFRSR